MKPETKRLFLEPLVEEHGAELFLGFKNPKLYEYIPRDAPQHLDDLLRRFRMIIGGSHDPNEKWLNWAIRSKETGKCFGQLEATVYPSQSMAEIAYFIFEEQWGKGLAKEACLWLCEYLHKVETCSTIVADIDSLNTKSMKLVEAVGFRRAQFRENADSFKGRNSDEWHYELTFK